MPKNKNTRREFIKVISAAPVGALFLNLSCSGTAAVAGDAGGTEKDAGMDASLDMKKKTDTSKIDVATTDTRSDDTFSNPADSGKEVDAPSQVCEPSGSDVEGPFHEPGAPERTNLVSIGEPGMPLIVTGRVLDENCKPIPGASLDVWHADDNGDYHDTNENFRCRGRMSANGQGSYTFTSVKPGRYPLGNSTRPAHVHFIVSQPGFVPLTTQMYFEGDPFLNPNDPCGAGCNSGDETLIVPFTTDADGTIRATFDIVLKKA